MTGSLWMKTLMDYSIKVNNIRLPDKTCDRRPESGSSGAHLFGQL